MVPYRLSAAFRAYCSRRSRCLPVQILLLVVAGLSLANGDDVELRPAGVPETEAAAPDALSPELQREFTPPAEWEADQFGPLLGLSPEQRAKLAEIVASARNDLHALREGAEKLSREQMQVRLPMIRERIQQVIAGYRQRLESVLTPAQHQRMREIVLQVRGFAAVQDPEIAAALELTDEQQSRVADTLLAAADARRKIAEAPRPKDRFERKDRRVAKRDLKKLFDDKLRSILTQEQVDELARMQGPPLGLHDLLLLQARVGTPTSAPGDDDLKPDLGDPKIELGKPAQ